MDFKGDIIITDPCYMAKKSDWGSIFNWEDCTISDSNFSYYIWVSTGVGDFSGSVKKHNKILTQLEAEDFVSDLLDITELNLKTEDLIRSYSHLGKFSVDSGSFGVFYLSEVLSYSPKLLTDYHSGCFTVVNDFIGNIEVWQPEFGTLKHFIGIGNKTIFTL